MGRTEIITDNLVRDFFRKYDDLIIVEQQSSQNPSIDKLLKNASKKGNGKGYPDFIIQFKNDKNLIIVIENKADKYKHQSESLKDYANYAVDGALLYASYLSRSYDVIVIAVSGNRKEELFVSHFLQLKDEPKAIPFMSNELLPPEEYYQSYNQSPEKHRQDYNALLDYTSELNGKLHSLGINEAERSVLISCILLALRIEKFKNWYKTEDDPSILTSSLVDDVLDWFKKEKVGDEKIRIIKAEYDKIKVKSVFNSKDGVLQDLICDIDENLNNFMQTHRYYDTLGELYVEFLRYANSDNKLGIVLTPPHITSFFAEIANVNEHSIVFDNCTGTCGFLIAAMRKMIECAKGNQELIKNIKQSQLIGVEKEEKMFCLAASNMAIHNDGKTNIIYGSGIDRDVLKRVEALKPTVGLLNPPYKADKKKDIEELEFVMSNLETLVDGGTCVAVVPMQCAISVKGRIAQLKKELLSKHTLKAVFSMPDELFYNSNVGVVTCIMVFTAHRPHPQDLETFFGYFKNDGFEKRKKKGRIDVYERWGNIKNDWLYLYKNNKNKAGVSVTKVITFKEEWCAEAYMETDYCGVIKDNFIRDLRDYSAFMLKNFDPYIQRQYTNIPVCDGKIELNAGTWKWFRILDYFDKQKGRRLTKADSIEGDIPLVTAGQNNQGINRRVDNDMIVFSNSITIDMFGYSAYRGYEFCCDDNILVLSPKEPLSTYVKIFLVTIINKDMYKCAYGRQYRLKTLERHQIKLPVTHQGKPDWTLMENYVKSLPYSANLCN